ncbi:Thiol:disulfide interchange protein (plasmid) [Rhodovastum atsumiense]|nr:Thiol:disulfide interchange protein [Rhodovastum atsumiense]
MAGRSKAAVMVSGRVRHLLLALTMLVVSGGVPSGQAQELSSGQPPVVVSDPFGASPGALNGQMTGRVALNAGDFQAITLAGRSGVYFVSGNGRYVLRGTIHDLWQGRELQTLPEIKAAAETVNFGALAQMVPEFEPFRIGTGQRQVIVFVDPFCPYCERVLRDVAALAQGGTHQFVVMPIALLGPESMRVVRNLHCAQDRDAALKALLTHSFQTPLAENSGCEVAALQKRLIFARLLQIRAVPFLIRDDGVRQEGLPGNLAAWLAEARG